jgi:COMPASS component BRE2
MADPGSSPTPQAFSAGLSPLKPPAPDDDIPYAPAVPSPLNPDSAATKAKKAAPAREQREKKDSLKKRESKGVETTKTATPDTSSGQSKAAKKSASTPTTYPELQRYVIEKPKPNDFNPPAPPVLAADMMVGDSQLHRVTEQYDYPAHV